MGLALFDRLRLFAIATAMKDKPENVRHFHGANSSEGQAAKKPRTSGDGPSGNTDARAARRQALLKERSLLPIWSAREPLLQLIRENRALVVVGETGSGKTTQIPQFLLHGGFAGQGGAIACTQPRRVAAMSVARRVAEEMGTVLGQKVGYSIRFEDMSR